MPNAPINNCSNCRYSWLVGLVTGSPAACCSHDASPRYRTFGMLERTCKHWEAKP